MRQIRTPFVLFGCLTLSQAVLIISAFYIPSWKSINYSGSLLGLLILANLIGICGYWASMLYIPVGGSLLLSKGLWGIDLNKHSPEAIKEYRSGQLAQGGQTKSNFIKIPEACGVITAFLYFVSLLTVYGCARICRLTLNAEQFMAGAMTICFTTFLGFVDDVIDLRWRHRVWLPYVASIPLLVAYNGSTTVRVPNLVRVLLRMMIPWKIPPELDLGWCFYLYMTNLLAFSSNTINIYAGVNGLEVGQTFICNAFIILYSFIELVLRPEEMVEPLTTSLIFSVVFMYTSAALLYHNSYPASVFVGDTFTMLAGVHLAAVAVMGHFSKTLILFLLPQILNFLYSLPQLTHLIPCPRHRIPLFDADSKKMYSSKNYTLINLALEMFGPMTEKKLVNILLTFQILCGAIGLVIRFSPVYNTIFV